MKPGSVLRLLREMMDPAVREHALMAVRNYRKLPDALCPGCGYKGRFLAGGTTMRIGARCPTCGMVERHRLIALAIQKKVLSFDGVDVLHFAPERQVANIIRKCGPRSYKTADIAEGKADMVLNIENMDVPDRSFDRIVCSHVLEHVDDKAALSEMHRVLRKGGYAILLTPVIEGWESTYETPLARTDKDRVLHYGQADHVRYFGADIRARILGAGFDVSEFTASGEDSATYGLTRGEKVFIARKA